MKANRPSFTLVIALLLALSPLASAALNPPLPTPGDLQEMYKAGQYRVCLQQIARVLQLTGAAAKPYDPNALYLLRGYCLLQLNDKSTALVAFGKAEKSPDSPQACEARAMTLLLRRSSGTSFSPPGAGMTLNLLEPADRQKGMMLLFEDGLKGAQRDIGRAIGADNLVPCIDLIPHMKDLYALELAGSGADAQTRPILMQLGEHARTLMIHELDLVDQRISATQDQANQSVDLGTGGGQWWWGAGRRGLWTSDRDNLNAWIDYANKILDTAQRGRMLAINFGATGEKWDPVISRAAQVGAHADQVLSSE